MTDCNTKLLSLLPLKSKKIECSFTGGNVTSDAGALLIREIDTKLRLTEKVDNFIPEYRNESYIKDTTLQMLRQRVYGIVLGYEDLNDHDDLRNDGVIQSAVGFEQSLGSSPTLCRFENQIADRKIAFERFRALVLVGTELAYLVRMIILKSVRRKNIVINVGRNAAGST